ncbi:hypothetical protein JCM18899A_02920 [Nocardioides sp. AN3]
MVAPLLVHDVFPAAWPGLVLAALVVAAAFAPRHGRRGGVLLGLLSGLWLLCNKRFEGGVLVVVMPHHGLTAGDLAGVAGLAIGGLLLARGRL